MNLDFWDCMYPQGSCLVWKPQNLAGFINRPFGGCLLRGICDFEQKDNNKIKYMNKNSEISAVVAWVI